MQHGYLDSHHQHQLEAFFNAVFSASEGADEGRLIAELAGQLAAAIDDHDVIGFATFEGDTIIAAIFLTRLRFAEPVDVFMLAPVAVSTAQQGRGIGQSLINHALDQLRARSVSVVVTYGDPGYYARVGFEPLAESVVQAPLPLSMPQGWLGQSLSGASVPSIDGRPACVAAFNNPAYW